MPCSVRNKFAETKPYTSNIMSDIANILSNNKIEYSSNKKSTEISIKLNDKVTPNIIKETIHSNSNVPNNILNKVTDTVKIKGQLFIRQTVK